MMILMMLLGCSSGDDAGLVVFFVPYGDDSDRKWHFSVTEPGGTDVTSNNYWLFGEDNFSQGVRLPAEIYGVAFNGEGVQVDIEEVGDVTILLGDPSYFNSDAYAVYEIEPVEQGEVYAGARRWALDWR